MSRVITWLRDRDERMFLLINHRFNHVLIRMLLSRITHLGGATATILATLGVWLFAPKPVSTVGMQAFLSLAISHIPVRIVKKLYPRLRPYLALPNAITRQKPLKDHSFPSGHTTAIFSAITPFVLAFHWAGFFLIPIAVIVGVSRMYVGLHYPSDVAVGCLIGCATAVCTVAVLG